MSIRYLTAGESHGPALTAIIEGLPAGLALNESDINHDLQRRQMGYGRGGRMAIERDQVHVTGGLIAGTTTGAPLALVVENRDWENWKNREVPPWTVPRPGHADLAGRMKYGLTDMRWIAERASARETTMRVAVGAVCKKLLRQMGVLVGSYVESIGRISASIPDLPLPDLWSLAEASDVRCPDPAAAEAIRRHIDETRATGDSLGGICLLAAIGVPPGLGSHVHWDRRLDGRVAQAIMSIPAIKGVEIGPAFDNARLRGTEVHDPICPDEQDADPSRAAPTSPGISRPTNRAGGIEGGMSNGQPIVVRMAMKPIPTTISPQPSVDMATGEPSSTRYQRSDVCALPAACVVGEAMLAWVLAQALLEKTGGDSMDEVIRNLQNYRRSLSIGG